MSNNSQLPADFYQRSRSEQIKLMSDAMRAIDPEKFDQARASVRKNMAAMIKYQPQLLRSKRG